MTEQIDRALNMFSTALEMEENGKVFYEKASKTCKNKLGREIFRVLMEDELVHMERIKRIYASIKGDRPWTDEWKALTVKHEDLGGIFRELAASHGKNIYVETTDMEALDIGLDFEAKSVNFYEDHLRTAVEPSEKEFLQRMIREEQMHYSIISEMKYYLTDPAARFMEPERAGLDGA